jgi:death-on-curing protein
MDRDVVRTSVKIGLLDSALNAPLAGFGDADLYPTTHQRLAVLCSRTILNHRFIDGNKRTGFLLMLEAAALNKVLLHFPNQHAVADKIDGLAARTLEEDDFAAWLADYVSTP